MVSLNEGVPSNVGTAKKNNKPQFVRSDANAIKLRNQDDALNMALACRIFKALCRRLLSSVSSQYRSGQLRNQVTCRFANWLETEDSNLLQSALKILHANAIFSASS
jgi:hypothetical protein